MRLSARRIEGVKSLSSSGDEVCLFSIRLEDDETSVIYVCNWQVPLRHMALILELVSLYYLNCKRLKAEKKE